MLMFYKFFVALKQEEAVPKGISGKKHQMQHEILFDDLFQLPNCVFSVFLKISFAFLIEKNIFKNTVHGFQSLGWISAAGRKH